MWNRNTYQMTSTTPPTMCMTDTTATTSTSVTTLYIPLSFWFDHNPELAVPIFHIRRADGYVETYLQRGDGTTEGPYLEL